MTYPQLNYVYIFAYPTQMNIKNNLAASRNGGVFPPSFLTKLLTKETGPQYLGEVESL
jgi:hypothetical protein